MARTMNDRNVKPPRGLLCALELYGVLFRAAAARYVHCRCGSSWAAGLRSTASQSCCAAPTILPVCCMPWERRFTIFLAWTTIVTEIAGGICILLGAFVPLVSIPMAAVLLVAIFTVHLQYGFSSMKLQEITPSGAHFGQPGYETDLLYLACMAALVVVAADRSRWLAGLIRASSARSSAAGSLKTHDRGASRSSIHWRKSTENMHGCSILSFGNSEFRHIGLFVRYQQNANEKWAAPGKDIDLTHQSSRA